MKKILFGLLLLCSTGITAQRNCGTMHHQQMLEQQDPKVTLQRQAVEAFTAQYVANHLNANNSNRAVITIPVVVHVVYNTAVQNISDAQIQSQIDALNKDFAKLNTDTNKIPAVWKSLAANTNIQFCLAQRDPNGAATTGITRTSTTVTSFIDDDKVKKASTGGHDAWPAASYLNLWVCKLGSSLLGYAQFPGGPAATDGVVITYTGFGTMGTAAAPYNLGRTATHEVGHWLSLYHIWGDDGGSCSGSDQVGDTPNQANSNGGAPTFPKTDACSPSSPGVMFMNYMDYTNDNSMYMFTNGQNTRIQSLFATGGSKASLLNSLGCVPVSNMPTALFTGTPTTICPGGSVAFASQSIGAPTSYTWTFTGGTPATSTAAAPTVVYNTPGSYSVKLVVSNSFGKDSLTKTAYINVVTATTLPVVEGFESTTFPPTNWTIGNPDNLTAWVRTTSASGFGTSTASAYFDNYTTNYSGQKDYIYTPSYDFTNVTNGRLKWDYAYTYYNTSYDSLQIMYSLDCGATWTSLWKKGGVSLATATGITAKFVPTATQWKRDSVSLTALLGKNNVKFAFINITKYGNSLLLDNINIFDVSSACNKPVADFTAAPTTVTVGNSVAYTDLSTNTPTSWAWTFAGGTPATSTAQNPSVAYNTVGTYAVTLTATNTCGASTATTKTAYINVIAAGVSVCDTPSNWVANDTLRLYSSTNGYVSGNNSAPHVGFADKFTTALTGAQVSGVFLGFGVGKVATSGKTATVKVWDGTSGTPGTVLASTTVLYSTIVTNVTNAQETYVSFPTPATVPANYFVGIEVTNSAGDTIVLITSQISNSSIHTNHGYYKLGTTWATYNSLYGVGLTNYIFPVICSTASVPPPVAKFKADKTSVCAGSSVVFTDTSANTPTSWSWTFTGGTPAASSTQSPTVTYATAGTYAVKLVVFNAGGKDSLTKTGYIIVNANPTVSTSTVAVSCYGGSTGSATATGASGTPTYTYAWTGGGTGATISGKPAGAYTVTVTDSKQCTATALANISQPFSALSLSMGQTNAYCGQNNGTVTATPSGGSGGFTYVWSGGLGTTQSLSNLGPNNYAVTVTDQKGCTISGSIDVITDPNNLSVTFNKTNATCGQSNGSAVAIPSGSSIGMHFQWSTGDTISSINALSAGTYQVTVTNASGCTASASVVITGSSAVTASIAATNASCGSNDGAAVLTVTPAGTYTYLWSNGQTTKNLSSLGVGTYTVTVTASAGGCTATATATVSNVGGPTVNVTGTNLACFGTNAGSALANASGGTGTLSYTWSNGGTSASISSLVAGTYTVTVKDNLNCSVISAYTVTSPAQITANASSSAVSCFAATDGTATALANGGTGTLTYTWSNSATTALINNIAAGTYTVTIKDANNCTISTSTVVASPAQINISATPTAVKCFGGNDGSVNAIVTGGTGTLSYSWNSTPAQTTSSANGLTAGSYTVTVKDANNCTLSASATVSAPAQITVSATSTSVKCNGGNDGSLSATASGGTGTLSYLWNTSPAQATPTATGIIAGTYTVTVIDGNLCSATASSTITQPAVGLSAATTQTGNSATIAATGGTAPYNYTWSTNPTQNTATATGLTTGSYTVTVVDANNCTLTKSVVLTSIIGAEAAGITLIKMYPNPSKGKFMLNVEMKEVTPLTLVLFDASGKIVYAETMEAQSSFEKNITIEHLASGIYTAQFKTQNGIATQKLIIE